MMASRRTVDHYRGGCGDIPPGIKSTVARYCCPMRCMSEAPKPDAGTVERFRAVVLPHLDAAYGFARWLARDPVLAQDLAQEAWLRALRYFHACRGEEARPWLLRIVRNTWSDLRARKNLADRSLDEAEDQPADGPDPEQGALAGDRRRQVAAALAALPA